MSHQAHPRPDTRASILPAGTLTFLVADGVTAFESASDAVARALARRATDAVSRMAIHTGEARIRDDGVYIGPAVRTAEYLAEIAHPGMTLVSAAAASAFEPPDGVSLVDVGQHRLGDLSAPLRVFELRAAEQAGQPLPPRSLDRVPNNLPVHLTGFVGRHTELAAVRTLLRSERLVTLTGVGGAGKSRLAAQVAAACVDERPDGAWWIELDSVFEPSAVASAIAQTIGVLVEPVGGALRSMVAQLRECRVLIVLDNCEQVLDGVADVARALLQCCPEAVLLATSREPLGVPGEVVWQVPPLDEPDALALFVERASRVRPWFTLDASSEAAVRTMCARLDGIPLALELAAAWLRTLTPRQIEAGLDDRFALLVRGPRGAAPRQQTLAASIDWSHTLLDAADQIVFRRLAVFLGGFDLEAARAVCAASIDAIGRLVDKSLVVMEQRCGEARYRLLETIREYAAGRLAEADEFAVTRDRHLDYFLGLVAAMAPDRQRDMDAWRARLELDYDNLRAALDWGLALADAERGRRLAAGLQWLWHLRAHGSEGLEYLRRAIECAPGDRSRLQAQLLAGVALVADTASPLDLEFDAAQRALEIASEQDDAGLRALCLELSAVGQFYTDFVGAWALSVDALRAAEVAGDWLLADGARALQGIILHLRDQHAEADPLLSSAVEALRRRHRGIAATTLGYQALGALYTDDLERALTLAQRAVEVAEPLGDYLRVGSTRAVLGFVHGFRGNVEEGLAVLEPVVRLTDSDERAFIPGLPYALGWLELWRGAPEAALRWFERDAGSSDRGHETFLAAQALPGLAAALLALDRADQARTVLERAVALARRLDMPRVLAEALHLQAGLDRDNALDLYHEALSIRVEHNLRAFYGASLEGLAALGIESAETARLQVARGSLSLDDAVAYVRRSRGSRGRPATGWASLTPTELDVVHAVVDGLNNPEIGRRLFMSRGTVKTHLSHIFAKVGVSNRTGLATLAASWLTDRRPGRPARGCHPRGHAGHQ